MQAGLIKEGTVTLRYNAQTQQHIEEASADRANDTPEHLACKLAEFLTAVLREVPRVSADCENIAVEKIREWTRTREGGHFYDDSALVLHKKCGTS